MEERRWGKGKANRDTCPGLRAGKGMSPKLRACGYVVEVHARRHYLSQEPDAIVPQVRIREGGGP